MAKSGFRDSYRAIYPDEMKNPGLTWSPAYKVGDPRTHHDRIDFVYFKGKGLQVIGVKILGENKENADLVLTPYPSDHRAVVATFTLPENKMKLGHPFFLVVSSLWMMGVSLGASDTDKTVRVRVAAY